MKGGSNKNKNKLLKEICDNLNIIPVENEEKVIWEEKSTYNKLKEILELINRKMKVGKESQKSLSSISSISSISLGGAKISKLVLIENINNDLNDLKGEGEDINTLVNNIYNKINIIYNEIDILQIKRKGGGKKEDSEKRNSKLNKILKSLGIEGYDGKNELDKIKAIKKELEVENPNLSISKILDQILSNIKKLDLKEIQKNINEKKRIYEKLKHTKSIGAFKLIEDFKKLKFGEKIFEISKYLLMEEEIYFHYPDNERKSIFSESKKTSKTSKSSFSRRTPK